MRIGLHIGFFVHPSICFLVWKGRGLITRNTTIIENKWNTPLRKVVLYYI